eukprot:UN34166
MYLEPIFTSGDIKKQLPEEASLFGQIDTSWRKIMTETEQNSDAYYVVNIPDLLEKFKKMLVGLEKIQKGLNHYLETKRLYFPRFFFNPNDELLTILADGKHPQKTQPHIKKCFTFTKVGFNEDNILQSMISSEGEVVPLVNPIDTNIAKGA